MSDTSFGFLLLGSLAAVGLALVFGTLAAVLRYRRTGAFPGAEPGDPVTQGQVRGLYVRIVLGVVLTIVGVLAIVRTGMF